MAGGLWSETCVGSQLGQKGWPELIALLITAAPSHEQVSSSKELHGLSSEVARSPSLAREERLSCQPSPCPASWPRAMAPCYLRLCAVTFCYKTFEVLRIGSPVITLPTTDCLSPGA